MERSRWVTTAGSRSRRTSTDSRNDVLAMPAYSRPSQAALCAYVEQVAATLWYPLWDAGAKIDHSVRAVSEVTSAAHADPRVALGLLDVRPVEPGRAGHQDLAAERVGGIEAAYEITNRQYALEQPELYRLALGGGAARQARAAHGEGDRGRQHQLHFRS